MQRVATTTPFNRQHLGLYWENRRRRMVWWLHFYRTIENNATSYTTVQYLYTRNHKLQVLYFLCPLAVWPLKLPVEQNKQDVLDGSSMCSQGLNIRRLRRRMKSQQEAGSFNVKEMRTDVTRRH